MGNSAADEEITLEVLAKTRVVEAGIRFDGADSPTESICQMSGRSFDESEGLMHIEYALSNYSEVRVRSAVSVVLLLNVG